MRVIIVGAGKVGNALVNQISRENVDIVVIDKSEACIEAITDAYDCNGFVGNGSCPELLKKAGIDAASMLVALTKSDETNVLCCSVAKAMGVKRTVAAVRGSEYVGTQKFYSENLGVDVFVNPDMAAAAEVSKLIRFVGEIELEHFGDGDVSVATVKVGEDSVLAETEMSKVQARLGVQALICAIDRNGKAVTPKGGQFIKAGDIITMAAIGENMEKALLKLGFYKHSLKKTVIVGGGRIGRYLAKQLIAEGVKVIIIEKNPNQCNKLVSLLPEAEIICGDGSNIELMEQQLKGVDACVVMSGRDEENLIISMFAKAMGMERIAAEMDNENYDEMLRKSGIKHTFSNRDVSIEEIVHEVRTLIAAEDDKDNNVIKWLYNFNHGRVEAVEFELTEEFKLLGIPFKSNNFKLKPGILIAIIVRDGIAFVPNGESVLKAGDRVILTSVEYKISKLTEIIA